MVKCSFTNTLQSPQQLNLHILMRQRNNLLTFQSNFQSNHRSYHSAIHLYIVLSYNQPNSLLNMNSNQEYLHYKLRNSYHIWYKTSSSNPPNKLALHIQDICLLLVQHNDQYSLRTCQSHKNRIRDHIHLHIHYSHNTIGILHDMSNFKQH